MRSRITAAALLAAAAVTAACGTQAGPSPSAPFRPAAAAASVIGVTAPGIPQSWAPAAAFSTAIGRPANLVMYYSGWGESFRSSFAATARQHGAQVMVNMDPGPSLAAIARGDGDGYLRRFAAELKAFGHPVVLAFGHEANGDWYRYGYRHQPAADYIAAYRKVHDVITSAGAKDVTWLWTVNVPVGKQTLPPSADWPGAAYVTETGIDGYDWTGKEDFAQEFGPAIAAVRKLSAVPVLIAETSVVPGKDAAAQVTGLLDGIRTYGLLGLVWFDTDKAGYRHTADTHDWRLQDDPAALAAFRAGTRGFG
jgi:Glycosyl hydrolase family 26